MAGARIDGGFSSSPFVGCGASSSSERAEEMVGRWGSEASGIYEMSVFIFGERGGRDEVVKLLRRLPFFFSFFIASFSIK